MLKYLFAALVALTSIGHTEEMFVYDKADIMVPAKKLENPLLYDPSTVVSADKTYVTWLEFLPGKGDVIWFGAQDSAGNWLEKQQISKDPGDFAKPTLTVDAKTNLWLSYETATNGKWDIVAGRRTAQGTFSFLSISKFQIPGGEGANIEHRAAAAVDEGIWIVWQGDNGGEFDIFARHLSEAESETMPVIAKVSDSPLGDWHPAVTVTPDNRVIVAWDSYNGKSYNIYARELTKGAWGEIVQVTSSSNFNANVQAVSDKQGRIWISWEEDGPNWGKAYRTRVDARKDSQKMSDDHGSLHRFRFLHLAELNTKGQQVKLYEVPQPSFTSAANRTNAPAGIKKLGVFYQSSQLAVDGANRLWLVYRHFYMPGMGITAKTHVQNDWGIYARSLENDAWSGLYRFEEGQGDALQRISIAPKKNGISVAWTFGRTDRRNPQNWFEDDLAPNKVVAHVARKGVQGALEEENESAQPKKKAKARKANTSEPAPIPEQSRGIAFANVENTAVASMAVRITTNSLYRGEHKAAIQSKPPRPAYDFTGKHFELFYGDFHRHTDISLCFWPGDGTMDDAYRYGIDAAPLDFLGVTDHTHDIAMGDPLSLLWQRIRKEVNRHALTNSFVPFYSYERSRGETDHNVISLRDDMLRPHTYPHAAFWKELDTNTITIPHQPFNAVLWKTNDREHRPLMEIFQGFRNHTCEADAKMGLDSGNEVGFIASSDHLSTGASYACVWAEKPTRESIFRALQARRTFAATDHIVLRVTCGDHWMGEKFSSKETPRLDIAIDPTAKIKTIEIFVDGERQTEIPHDITGPRKTALANFLAEKKLTGPHTFFVRVTQVDGNMAWSSPLWINIQPQD